MSGTTMSTPKSSASGNIKPASMTMMSSPQRTAMQFIPNSPRPPRGTICNFPVGIGSNNASTGGFRVEGLSRGEAESAEDLNIEYRGKTRAVAVEASRQSMGATNCDQVDTNLR